MIKWLKKLFGIDEGLKERYLQTLKDYKDLVIKQQMADNRYITISQFDTFDREFIRKISAVQEMEEMKFLIFDMKQKYIDMMLEGDIGGNLQVEKAFYILKGISMVERNLNEYKSQWNAIVNRESQNANQEI